MTNSERLALFARGSRAPVVQQLSVSTSSQSCVRTTLSQISGFQLYSRLSFLSCLPPPIHSQVSFRYHCQLYSEWRRTNQKVRLLMPDMKGAHTTQRSVPTKSTKKMTDETIV